jgi:hypothetical protein
MPLHRKERSMSTLVKAGSTAGISLLALLMLSTTLAVPDAEARKKKINTVQCVVGQTCEGTDGRDRLLGTDSSDQMVGKGGKDIYRSNGEEDDPDFLDDRSTVSSDAYFVFGGDFVTDLGGPADVLDLGSLRLFDDVTFTRSNFVTVPGTPPADELRLLGPPGNSVLIVDHFGRGRIETLRFANGTVSGGQAASLAGELAPGERLQEDEIPARSEE